MERIYQSISADGLQIPIALMRQYGLKQGSGVMLELEPDGIRIVPARPERAMIENRALRYLLSTVGDGATVEVHPLPDGTGWQVDVYGFGLTKPAGMLVYSLSGALLVERSTPLAEIRRAIPDAANQP
jgi:hypothetical protein